MSGQDAGREAAWHAFELAQLVAEVGAYQEKQLAYVPGRLQALQLEVRIPGAVQRRGGGGDG